MFRELEVVLVRKLRSITREVDGTAGAMRQPRIGDQGTVVLVLGDAEYAVESVKASGLTVWLADFHEDELAAALSGWTFAVEEVSAGVYRATGIGPGGLRVEATDTDDSIALSRCRELAIPNT